MNIHRSCNNHDCFAVFCSQIVDHGTEVLECENGMPGQEVGCPISKQPRNQQQACVHRDKANAKDMDNSTRFNLFLQQLSQKLSNDDIEYIKFLCEWVIPQSSRRMEGVRSGVDLFKLLQDEAKLSAENLAFLKWILASIRREHLLDGYSVAVAVNREPLSVQQRSAECLVQIAQSLSSKEVGELQFFFRRKLEMAADWKPLPTELFLELRKQILLNETDLSTLREALRNIRRFDLVNQIDKFQEAQLINEEVKQNLNELHDEFFHLANGVEDSLKSNSINVEVLMRRFRSLPPSIRRQQEIDELFSEVRQTALKSTTIKELFNNLTKLKYWSFIAPEILTYIIRDVEEVHFVKKIHFDIAVYESKLLNFKTKTKVKDLIGCENLLPKYYLELHIKVRGWQEKNIIDAEKSVCTLLARAGYQDPKLGGLQCVKQGCIELTYVLLESITTHDLSKKELFDTYEDYGVLSISIDQDIVYDREKMLSVKGATGTSTSDSAGAAAAGGRVEWYETGSLAYSAQGGRDVLIVESDIPLSDHNPDVVSRRPAELTDGDKQKLKSQGISSDELHEASIIRTRYEKDKRRTLFRILRSEPDQHQLQRQNVFDSIVELFKRTNNDGVIVYYIGAGKRGTGDWCFEDGFITFRDITQLYLTHLKHRVLTIVSDCSYSGCWVRDCTEFLDEQGVQPCGHKARERGMLIKVYASCGPTQIPTRYQFSVHGAANDKNNDHMFSYTSKKLLDTQHTYSVNSSMIRCADKKKIEDECELPSDYTWQKWRKKEQIQLIVDESQDCPTWQYVLMEETQAKIWEVKEKKERREPFDVTQYGQILKSGLGNEPPNEVKYEMEREYGINIK